MVILLVTVVVINGLCDGGGDFGGRDSGYGCGSGGAGRGPTTLFHANENDSVKWTLQ